MGKLNMISYWLINYFHSVSFIIFDQSQMRIKILPNSNVHQTYDDENGRVSNDPNGRVGQSCLLC